MSRFKSQEDGFRTQATGDDDVEGHARKVGAPEGLRKVGAAGDDDVEGHARKVGAPEGLRKVGAPEGLRKVGAAGDDDVEGHTMLPNSMLSRSEAQNRERDIQRNLKQHDLKSQARRPFFKKDR
jgi:hypothetical protein